jgi:hypothetical protein
MINEFIESLNENNIIARITGGQCYKKYFDENENTIDIDIHIYISYKQLKNKKTFEIIYNCIKNLYKNYKKKYDLLPFPKFTCAKYSKKYINYNLIQNVIEFYNSNVICDIQIEDIDYSYVDIGVYVTDNINKIKENIEEDFYMSKYDFIKQINNYYDNLVDCSKDKNKIEKIRNRIKFISLCEN